MIINKPFDDFKSIISDEKNLINLFKENHNHRKWFDPFRWLDFYQIVKISVTRLEKEKIHIVFIKDGSLYYALDGGKGYNIVFIKNRFDGFIKIKDPHPLITLTRIGLYLTIKNRIVKNWNNFSATKP